ncbi:MAG TPA: ABC transporter permease [Anaerolineaceae bacterium]
MAAIQSSLSRPSFRSNLRALYMIAAKDWTQYWRYPLNAVGFLLQPLVWITPAFFMGQAFSVNGQAKGFAAYSGTGDFISFMLLGMVLSNFITSVFWGIGYALKDDMDSGVLESNWLTPTSRPILLIARTFSNMFTTLVISAAMMVIAAALFGFRPTGDALLALVPVIPMLVGLYGFGLAFAAVVLLMRDANTLVDVGSFLVQLLSGAQFPIQALPRFMLPIALALPLTYGFDASRGILLKTNTVLPVRYEIGLLVVFMFVMIWVGLKVFNNMERKVRMKGTLGQH